jgi:hypothetical protein
VRKFKPRIRYVGMVEQLARFEDGFAVYMPQPLWECFDPRNPVKFKGASPEMAYYHWVVNRHGD